MRPDPGVTMTRGSGNTSRGGSDSRGGGRAKTRLRSPLPASRRGEANTAKPGPSRVKRTQTPSAGGKAATTSSTGRAGPATTDSNLVSRLNAMEDKIAQLISKLSPGTLTRETSKNTDLATTTFTLEQRTCRMECMLDTLIQTIEKNSANQKTGPTIKPNGELKKRKKTNYVPFVASTIDDTSNYKRFYNIKFSAENKRSINPFKLEISISQIIGSVPKSLTTSGRDSFSVEVQNDAQGEKLQNIKTIDNVPCQVQPNTFLNNSKGIIYVNEFNIDNIEEFSAGLIENYNSITTVTEATFIKPKFQQTSVFLIEFAQETLPEYIYIPGERMDTRVYPYVNKPLHCSTCQKYGHSKTRCNGITTCSKCGQQNHVADNCLEDRATCLHCGGPHRVKDKTCPKQVEEETILKIQNKYRVGKIRARQIFNGTDNNAVSTETASKLYTTHFTCKIDENEKRHLTPWVLEKCLHNQLGNKPKSIRSGGRSSFVIEVDSEKDSRAILNIKTIHNIPIHISEHVQHNSAQGLIYIYEYDLKDFDTFRPAIIEKYNLNEAIQASWIKPRNPRAIPLLLTFKQCLPEYIDLPGEQSRTKVYEYLPKPMLCKQCLEYGHTKKHCSSESKTCGKCDERGHCVEQCTSRRTECHHCEAEHYTGSNKCPEFKYQKEILTIQRRNKLSRSQAKLKLDRDQPNFKKSFVNALLNNITHALSKPKAVTNSIIPPISAEMEVETSDNKRKRNRSNETPNDGKKRLTEAVCVNPTTGDLFTTPILIETGEPVLSDSETTSENNPRVRNEAKSIYAAYSKNIIKASKNSSASRAPNGE